MSCFLFTTLPTNDLGLLTRSLPIADELAGRGHRVLYCSPAGVPRRVVAEAGFENLMPRHALYEAFAAEWSLQGLLDLLFSGKTRRGYGGPVGLLRQLLPAIPFRRVPLTPEIWNMDHAGAIVGLLNRGFVRANCEALRNLLVDCDADVVVDFWNPFACIAARSLSRPLVSVIQADGHPANRGFMWWREAPPEFPSPVPAVNEVLESYGLAPVRKLEELSLGDHTLVLGTPETDPVPEDAQVTYVGSILWQKRGASLPPWLEGFDHERPLIWVYSGNPRYRRNGTPLDSAIVVDACVAALAEEDAHVVLTTGHHALPPEAPALPANFRLEPYLPGLAMAERSDLMVHHGGYGSCQTGLHTGTPAVIIPTFSERESNARRIASLGAGELVLPRRDPSGRMQVPTDELRAAIRRVLGGKSYKQRATQLGEKLKAYGGAAEAAASIERFADQVLDGKRPEDQCTS